MKIGILGGGQLSRLLALSGISLGLDFCFYHPKNSSSQPHLGTTLSAEYDDHASLEAFAHQVDVITYENENIHLSTLDFLRKFKPVYPDRNALEICQDRLNEKNLFSELGIPTNQYLAVNNKKELLYAIENLGLPLMLKKRTQGYDGKGQVKITQLSAIDTLTDEQCQNAIAEEFISFDREISLIIAKNSSGDFACYDLCENIHKNRILFKTENKKDDPFYALARSHLEKISSFLNYVGVLTVEFFQIGNKLIANEMAPRVHNSGHWTIDACMTSQFQNHLRAILNWPLGSTSSLAEVVMYNLVGTLPSKTDLLRFKSLNVYDYQKSPEIGRKLGHITLLKETNALQAGELMKIFDGS